MYEQRERNVWRKRKECMKKEKEMYEERERNV